MPRNRVVIKGRINSEKVVKKIKKKAGKRAEILKIEEVEDGSKKDQGAAAALQETPCQYLQIQQSLLLDHPCWDNEVYNMFSDENPNACSIM
ncbi:OLC1v1020301C2 [Oldenlandia corymbosa var. corymbosa]|nr:OLC1v1020301C2 [Oldenlandia corymbosa var. corymbosa]